MTSSSAQGGNAAPAETVNAAYWLARLRNEELSEEDAARFKAWLSADPAHQQEFDQLSALWNKLEGLANAPEILVRRQQLKVKKPAPRRRPAVAGWALAASVVISVALLFWLRESPVELYTTDVGDQKTLPLNDGTVITLNTSSQVRLRYSKEVRSVELLAGQATFEVAKDAKRPFVVSTGDGQVRALGTVFDVYKREDEVIVTLIEGRVEVLPDVTSTSARTPAQQGGTLQPTPGAIVLNAGEQVSYGPRRRTPVPAEADVQRAAAWRSRLLDFQETPLAEAIIEANRYSNVKIELHAPPEVGAAGISGVFATGRNDALAEAFRSYFGLEIEHPRPDLIVLKPRSP